MPLIKGTADKSRDKNIAEMMKNSSMSRDRVVAAAYQTQRTARKKERAK